MEQNQKVLPSGTRKLFRLLKITRRRGIQSLAKSPLRNVPPELLPLIVGYLPLVSASSFALCCQPLAAIFRPRDMNEVRLQAVRDGLDQRAVVIEWMTLLDRDIPDHTACYRCLDWHSNDEVYEHVPSNWHFSSRAPCWKRRADSPWSGVNHRQLYLLHHNFSISTFQRMMRHHREGLDCRDLLQALTLKTTGRAGHFVTMQHNSRPRIINGSLVLRTQIAFLMADLIGSQCFFIICPHSGIVRFDTLSDTTAVKWCQAIVWETVKYYQWSLLHDSENAEHRHTAWRMVEGMEVDLRFAPGRLHQCRHCRTEFRIDFKEFEGYGIAMFITKWHDLGNGEDEKWRSQLVGLEGPTDTQVSFQAGSICEAFRAQVSAEGENDLRDERYLTYEDKKLLLETWRSRVV